MRRENRMKTENNTKTYLYLGGSIVAIGILIFIAIFVLSGGSSKENDTSQFSTAKIDSLVPNDTRSDILSNTQQASTQIGKSVNEAQNMLNQASNTVTTTPKLQSTLTNTIKATSKNPIVSNTTGTTTQTNSTNTVKKENEETKTEVQQPKKEEKNPVFVRPVEGEIIREYAKEKLVYSETLKEWITHPGIDIKAEKTSVVKAAADGRVSSIKNDPRYGLTVVVEHQNGFKTVYSNLLTAEFVTEGEDIKSGQTIGTIGNTSTFEVLDDDHLHFEILKDNENVDPNIYMQ